MKQFDADEIRKAISILKPKNELFEIRILKGYKTYSGYFNDADTLINELSKMNLQDANVYITLQEVHHGCEARLQYGKFMDSKSAKFPTTSDNDILAYRFFPVDLDPVRPSGISSTKEELEYAKQTADEVASYMRAMGWDKCIFAFSGNGYHLLFPCYYPVWDKQFIEEWMEKLNVLFSNDQCKIDTTLSNPSRIIKLYGTYACKGRSTADRPHRLSKILGVYGED